MLKKFFPKVSTYRRDFDKTKCMSFLTKKKILIEKILMKKILMKKIKYRFFFERKFLFFQEKYFLRKYKNFFNLGARKFHFLKYKKFFQSEFFLLFELRKLFSKFFYS